MTQQERIQGIIEYCESTWWVKYWQKFGIGLYSQPTPGQKNWFSIGAVSDEAFKFSFAICVHPFVFAIWILRK